MEKRRRTAFTLPSLSSTILCVAPAGNFPSLSRRAAWPVTMSDSVNASASATFRSAFAAGRCLGTVLVLVRRRGWAGLGTGNLSRSVPCPSSSLNLSQLASRGFRIPNPQSRIPSTSATFEPESAQLEPVLCLFEIVRWIVVRDRAGKRAPAARGARDCDAAAEHECCDERLHRRISGG